MKEIVTYYICEACDNTASATEFIKEILVCEKCGKRKVKCEIGYNIIEEH